MATKPNLQILEVNLLTYIPKRGLNWYYAMYYERAAAVFR